MPGPISQYALVKQPTQLNASGGNVYQWLPVTGLSNPSIPNPIASPAITTNYRVLVGVTGCAKLRSDTVAGIGKGIIHQIKSHKRHPDLHH
jgi:hypothetical protein